MDELKANNSVLLCGAMAAPPAFSHESRGERFLAFPLETERLSGAIDRINIVAREELLAETEAGEADRITVTGELRSFNNRSGTGAKLVITVFARAVAAGGDEDANRVELSGSLCRAPNLRTTPMGRDICDLMLAVNRRCGRSDYLPCICWGLRAREAAEWSVGDTVTLSGRVQSRKYIKLTAEGSIEKTAFEVSASEIERLGS